MTASSWTRSPRGEARRQAQLVIAAHAVSAVRDAAASGVKVYDERGVIAPEVYRDSAASEARSLMRLSDASALLTEMDERDLLRAALLYLVASIRSEARCHHGTFAFGRLKAILWPPPPWRRSHDAE